jgi:dTDP-glucose 4,6-dehydratase
MRTFSTILVTGGCGFIGINLIHYLLSPASGFSGKIINLDKLTYAANPQALAHLQNTDRYHFVQGDVANSELVMFLLKHFCVEAICHLAAESHVDKSISSPMGFLQSNVMGTLSLLEAVQSQERFIHFHQVSTDEVFGQLADNDSPFNEASPYHPNNPYSASKASADHLVWAYHHTYGLPMTISHACNNYGQYQHPEKFIPRMVQALLAGNPLPLYGEGKQIRDWLHVQDHVEALWCIMRHGSVGESYGVGARNQWRNIDLLQLLCGIVAKQTNQPLDELLALITPVADRLGHDYRYAIDPSKLESRLTWQAQVPFLEGLTSYIQTLVASQ